MFVNKDGQEGGSMKYVPISKAPPDGKPSGPIMILLINNNHLVMVGCKHGVVQ